MLSIKNINLGKYYPIIFNIFLYTIYIKEIRMKKEENKSKEQLIHELIRIKKKNTELEEINREINQTKKQLTESERKYRDLVEETPVGIANTDITGKIFYINKKLEII